MFRGSYKIGVTDFVVVLCLAVLCAGCGRPTKEPENNSNPPIGPHLSEGTHQASGVVMDVRSLPANSTRTAIAIRLNGTPEPVVMVFEEYSGLPAVLLARVGDQVTFTYNVSRYNSRSLQSFDIDWNHRQQMEKKKE
jgi:hypothetical protein